MSVSIPSSLTTRFQGLVELGSQIYISFLQRELATSMSVSSHITPSERLQLYRLATGKKTVVEIGSYLGASALALASARRPPGSRVYCIDTWANDSMTEGARDTFVEFQSNTKEYRDQIVMLRGFSHDQAEILMKREPSIDFLFVDGDHSYEGVSSDWRAYRKMLRSGSVVAFHDYGWAEGVKRVIDEEVLCAISSSASLPNLWWGVVR